MSYEIICPYCFQEMRDDEVLFRSEKVSQEEDYPLPAGYHNRADFQSRYNGSNKDEILGKLDEWEFLKRQMTKNMGDSGRILTKLQKITRQIRCWG